MKKICMLCLMALVCNTVAFAETVAFADAGKQQKWAEVEEQICNTTDKLGTPVDEHIKKTVVILNVLGFKTNASCAGHIDRGLSPWITFSSADNEEAMLARSEQAKYIVRLEKETKKLQKKHPRKNIYHLGKKSEKLLEITTNLQKAGFKIMAASKKNLLQVNSLIAEFYKSRVTSHDRMLYIQVHHDVEMNTLHSLGCQWLDCYDDAAKAQRITEYQEELKLFTDFLIKHFDDGVCEFSPPSH